MTTETKDKPWYAIHTYSGYEDRVAENLRQRIETLDMSEKIFDIIVPKENQIEIKNGRRRLDDILGGPQQMQRPIVQFAPLRRQYERTGRSCEQAQAQLLLEALDRLADRRRRDGQRLRRCREAAVGRCAGKRGDAGQAIQTDLFHHGTKQLILRGIIKQVANIDTPVQRPRRCDDDRIDEGCEAAQVREPRGAAVRRRTRSRAEVG